MFLRQVTSVTGPAADGVTYTVALATDQVAAFVFIETDVAGHFSDNGFIFTVSSLEVTFTAREPTSAAELQSSIEITHLRLTY